VLIKYNNGKTATTGHRPIGPLLKSDRGKCPPCTPPK